MAEEVKEYPPINSAAHAVADAMMIAQYNLTAPRLSKLVAEKHRWTITNVVEREKLLRQTTAGECNSASLNVIYELCQKHAELFDYFLIVHGSGLRKEQYHDVFLAKSKNGEWFAGSPANHDEGWMDDFFRGFTLPDVIKQINTQGNYTWPEAEFIERKALRQYKKPKIEEGEENIDISVFCISTMPRGGNAVNFQPKYIPRTCFFPEI